jgi:hypothetical protein
MLISIAIVADAPAECEPPLAIEAVNTEKNWVDFRHFYGHHVMSHESNVQNLNFLIELN